VEKSVDFSVDDETIITVVDYTGYCWGVGFANLKFDEWGRLIGEVVDQNNKRGRKRKFQLKFPGLESALWFDSEACKDVPAEKDANTSVKFNVWKDGQLIPCYVHPRKKRSLDVRKYSGRINVDGKLVRVVVRQDEQGKLFCVKREENE
jgi:hypothetical protein